MLKIKTRKESKASWKNYLLKAKQYLETAQEAYLKRNWNAVGLNAVHSVICANDALTTYHREVRSVSEKHSDAAILLLEIFNNNEEVRKNSRHLLWLINRKNLVEYEARLFFQKEAREALKHAERFLDWTKTKLPES